MTAEFPVAFQNYLLTSGNEDEEIKAGQRVNSPLNFGNEDFAQIHGPGLHRRIMARV